MYVNYVQQRRRRFAFTLIELLSVIAIMVILMAVSVPALKSLNKSNGAASAVNMVTSYLASARAIAVSQHRQAGVVFFEETSTYAGAMRHSNQTAMQILIENTAQTTTNTVFGYYNTERQYLPAGVAVAVLNDSTPAVLTAQNTTGATSRVILFDSNGQLLIRNGIARPNLTGTAGKYPEAYGDWNLTTGGGTASNGVSSPGVFIYKLTDYLADTNGMTDANRSTWLQTNGSLILLNAITGGVIR